THLILLSPGRVALWLTRLRLTVSLLRLVLAVLGLAALVRIELPGTVLTVVRALAGLRLCRLLVLLGLALPIVGIGLIAWLRSAVVLAAVVLAVAELRGLRSAGGRLLTIGRGVALSGLSDLRAHPRR